jgi:uncharacterized protein YdhG (YjbR/CyaY superfamily)
MTDTYYYLNINIFQQNYYVYIRVFLPVEMKRKQKEPEMVSRISFIMSTYSNNGSIF